MGERGHGLRLYNTLGREMQEFVPITPGFAGFYGCGPTVYNYAHIGNLRAYVFLDTLDRVLTFLGYSKRHVMNITDIGHLTGDGDDGEDKMLRTAQEKHKSVMEVAQFYTDAFFRDIDSLNIIRPDVICRATEHIADMIDLIKRIEEKGHTYMAGGNLYYDVSTFADYGALMGRQQTASSLNSEAYRKEHSALEHARVAADTNKRNASDFVLWFTQSKFAGQALSWDSPWGRGYPGWHIECSAMSMKYLGEHFDIHTGGIDHIPIHHTNEIAQSEGATGHKWVNYWLHNEFLVIGKTFSSNTNGSSATAATKMSKSSGNFLTLQSLVDMGYDPMDYRLFLLGGHYRSQLSFSREAMDSAKSSRKALVARVARLLSSLRTNTSAQSMAKSASKLAGTDDIDLSAHMVSFRSALEDDLGTPKALAALQVAVKDETMPPAVRMAMVRRMDSVLGLQLEKEARALQALNSTPISMRSSTGAPAASGNGGGGVSGEEAARIEARIAERTAAKKARDYATADRIRGELAASGIILTDTKDGTTWKKSSV